MLGALYVATGGAYWTNSSGWASAAAGVPTPYCSFNGVSCPWYAPGEVQSLFLAFNNLTGTLPDAVGALTALTAIDLSYNSLHGLLPGALLDTLGSLPGTYTKKKKKLIQLESTHMGASVTDAPIWHGAAVVSTFRSASSAARD